jgi:hypothetical protein
MLVVVGGCNDDEEGSIAFLICGRTVCISTLCQAALLLPLTFGIVFLLAVCPQLIDVENKKIAVVVVVFAFATPLPPPASIPVERYP